MYNEVKCDLKMKRSWERSGIKWSSLFVESEGLEGNIGEQEIHCLLLSHSAFLKEEVFQASVHNYLIELVQEIVHNYLVEKFSEIGHSYLFLEVYDVFLKELDVQFVQ